MRSVNDNKILRDFAPKVEKEEIFHTSAYAVAQNGNSIGAGGSGIDMAKRQALDEQRQFIRGYNDAKIMSSLRTNQRRMVVAEQRARAAKNPSSTGGSRYSKAVAGSRTIGMGSPAAAPAGPSSIAGRFQTKPAIKPSW